MVEGKSAHDAKAFKGETNYFKFYSEFYRKSVELRKQI